MGKVRIVYEKTGVARYISHLDLMRVLRRSFARADIALTHSEGFNPHPFLSVALPLPVGVESVCELLDVKLEAEPDENLPERLNAALPPGLRAVKLTAALRPLSEIACIRYQYTLEPDGPLADWDEAAAYAAGNALPVTYETKSGEKQIELGKRLSGLVWEAADGVYRLTVDIAVADAPVKPALLCRALGARFPAMGWEQAKIRRLAVLDANRKIFL